MSSHHEWVLQQQLLHDELKPYAPENGEPLQFAIGDQVIWTSENGTEFAYHITGLYQPHSACALYAAGYRYFVNSDSAWFPKTQQSLRKNLVSTEKNSVTS